MRTKGFLRRVALIGLAVWLTWRVFLEDSQDRAAAITQDNGNLLSIPNSLLAENSGPGVEYLLGIPSKAHGFRLTHNAPFRQHSRHRATPRGNSVATHREKRQAVGSRF